VTISSGSKIGEFQIIGPLGAGGMGEVYRARDPRLGRDIAIKILPDEFSSDAERAHRFEQEARAASALNHPNIVSIYDIGSSDSIRFIAMELVDGQTLRELIDEGQLPVRRALTLAAQVAEGLAAAHGRGVVHRDLKPENILISKEGVAKILDFGLAKVDLKDEQQRTVRKEEQTRPGTVMGTSGYMSPEQARGRTADFRSDQFSFGAVLYEILTGQRAFQRQSSVQTLNAIIEDDPEPIATVNARIPPPLRWIVDRCLAKDPADRYASTRDLAHDLQTVREHLSEIGSGSEIVVARPTRRGLRLMSRVAAALALVGLGAVGALLLRRQTVQQPVALRSLTYSGHDFAPAASPDGKTIAFVSDRDGAPRIWIKQLVGGGEVVLSSGPDYYPRFSPDGSMLLFIRGRGADSTLYRMPLLGGEPRKLLQDVDSADWSPDGRQIAFARLLGGGSSLGMINSDGSNEHELYRITEEIFAQPRWSPDGRTIAASEFGASTVSSISFKPLLLLDIATRRGRRLMARPGPAVISSVVWISNDKLIYSQPESSVANVSTTPGFMVEHDIRRGTTRSILWMPAFSPTVDVIASGRIVFDAAPSHQNLQEITFSAKGPATTRWLTRGSSNDRQPVYSPDGKRIVFSSNRAGALDLWEVSVETGAVRRLTDDPADDWDPAFTPDGHLLWSSNRTGYFEVWTADADGSGARQLSHDGVDAENPTSTPDGKWIAYESNAPGKSGVWKMREDGSGAIRLVASAGAGVPEASPDNQHVIYVTGENPRHSIAVVYRLADGKPVFRTAIDGTRTSNTFIGRPRWMPDGRHLALVTEDARGVAGVAVQDFVPGRDTTATRLPLGGFNADEPTESFAISPDGRHMVVSARAQLNEIFIAEGLQNIAAPAHR
jgi:eukaryotic-like serine/threonine-protein kinase